jgi:hypothetical protein
MVDRSEIRSLIQSVLDEELGADHKIRPTAARENQELVTISNDGELAAFVKHIATLSKDETKRMELETGRHGFTLTGGSQVAISGTARTAGFDEGYINERQIDALSNDIEVVLIAKTARFTPLAKDRLRQRSIRIERKAS